MSSVNAQALRTPSSAAGLPHKKHISVELVFMLTALTSRLVGYGISSVVVFFPLLSPLKFCLVALSSAGVVPSGFVKP